MIRLHALAQAKMPQFADEVKGKSFVASVGWCNNFMNRNDFTLRRCTKISQKLPKDLEGKIDSFWQYIIKHRKMHNYELSQIGNMDETPMQFDLPGTMTVNGKGQKTIFVKTTGHEKTHFTVVLACMADGTKLKPMIIFKRKTLPKNAKFPSDVIVRSHPKGWMDEQGVKIWLSNVWNRRPGALLRKRSLLVWDMFRAHLCDSMKAEARKLKVDLAVIPGGLTSVLQPLDICLNKPFKDRLRRMWSDWISSDDVKKTEGMPGILYFLIIYLSYDIHITEFAVIGLITMLINCLDKILLRNIKLAALPVTMEWTSDQWSYFPFIFRWQFDETGHHAGCRMGERRVA